MVIRRITVFFVVIASIIFILPAGAVKKELVPKPKQSSVEEHQIMSSYEYPQVDPLLAAVGGGDLAGLKKLLEKDPKQINKRDEKGDTLLHNAAYSPKQSTEIVAYLISMGADVNAKGDLGATPLFSAVALDKCTLEMVSLLISKGANVNIKDNEGSTPLDCAIRSYCSPVIIEFLIKNGADVNAASPTGDTPLYWAVSMGERGYKVSEMLIAAGAKVNIKTDEGFTPLHNTVAVDNPYLPTVRMLLDKGAEVDARNNDKDTPLLLMVSVADRDSSSFRPDAAPFPIDIAKFLIERGASIDAIGKEGMSVLSHAAHGCPIEFVVYLLSKDANVNIIGPGGMTPLMAGVNRPEVVKLLLSKGADAKVKTDNGSTALMYAMKQSSTSEFNHPQKRDELNSRVGESAAMLIAVGVDVNAKTTYGGTALSFAVETCNTKGVKLLLQNGADVNVKDSNGVSPLMIALEPIGEMYSPEIPRLLIENGANVNETQPGGLTPLHYACDPKIIKLLVKKGVNINARTLKGRTPLHMATLNCSIGGFAQYVSEANVSAKGDTSQPKFNKKTSDYCNSIIDALVSNGASINAKDKFGLTPLHYAAGIVAGIDGPKLTDDGWNGTDGATTFFCEIVTARLLAKGADAKIRDNKGRTPLFYASSPEIAKALLAKGADINAKDKAGHTPLYYVNAEYSPELARFLRQHGAKKK